VPELSQHIAQLVELELAAERAIRSRTPAEHPVEVFLVRAKPVSPACLSFSLLPEKLLRPAEHAMLASNPHRNQEPERVRWFQAALVPEPNNPHDRNAVAVYADGVGLIGYLSRDDAIEYQSVFVALRQRGAIGRVPLS
jgi:hypothetical protein